MCEKSDGSVAATIRAELDFLKSQVRGQSVEIIRLKNKVERQEGQIKILLQERQSGDDGRRKRSASIVEKNRTYGRSSKQKSASKMANNEQSSGGQRIPVLTQFRSCHEISVAYDVSLQTLLGVSDTNNMTTMLYIDPDGQGIGAPPIYVLCNLTNGII